MRFSRPALLCLLAIVCASSANADEKYTLRYKFALGDVLRYHVNHSMTNRTTMEETTQNVESESTSVKAWKVTDVLPNGEIEFLHMVESLKMTNRQPSQGVAKYNSATDATPPPMFQQAASAVGVPLTVIRMTPAGKIVNREVKHPQPEATEDMPITLELPSEPVAVGDKWDFDYELPMEKKNKSNVQVRTRRLCELLSVKSGVATIKVTYQVLTPIEAFVQSQLLERMTKGEVRFDIEKGRVISQEHEVDQRVLGFAGKTSSMHFVSKLEERLLKPGDKVAEKVVGSRQ